MPLVTPIGKAGKTVLNAEWSESVLKVSVLLLCKTAHTISAHIVTSSSVCQGVFKFFSGNTIRETIYLTGEKFCFLTKKK